MNCIIELPTGRALRFDSSKPIDIGIPFEDGSPLRCFGAPALELKPMVAGDFIGSISAGAPVNFYNLHINPHGNGTHTECVRHIADLPVFIGDALYKHLFYALLVTIHPEENTGGDFTISYRQLKENLEDAPPGIEALIVRTTPNDPGKMTRDYTGTNPPYFKPEGLAYLRNMGIAHLLTDLPSVDREKDGGQLAAHKAFWNVPEAPRTDATITELIYVPDTIEDGAYVLGLQPLDIRSDVSPSSPVLYATHPLEAIRK